MNTLTGKTLQGGKYTLEQELGRGGFGITYKATHHYLHSTVVIKTLDESFRFDANCGRLLRQFQDEARRLALCVHPNIVRISDFFLEAGWPYMVMEYVSGQTLSKVVQTDSPLEEATAVRYIRQIGEALKLVHQQGLLHRDVKPDNILVREETQEVVLIDFGIAREFTPDTTQTHTSIVSDGYAPIEQYLTRAKWTPATDVYGLAATLYWLLTAKKPVSVPLRDREPLPTPQDLRPELSVSVNNAVLRGMAVEVQYRPQTMDEWLWLLPHDTKTQPTYIPVATSQPQTEKTIFFSPRQTYSVPSPPSKKLPILGITLIAIATGITVAAGVVWSRVETSVTQPIEEPTDIDKQDNSDILLEEPNFPTVESPVQPPVQKVQPRRVPVANPPTQRELPPPKPKAIEKQVPFPVESPSPSPESIAPTPVPTPEVLPTTPPIPTEPVPEATASPQSVPQQIPVERIERASEQKQEKQERSEEQRQEKQKQEKQKPLEEKQ